MKRLLLRLLLIGALAGGGWWLWQRVFVTDAQRVQRQLSRLAHAVETGGWLKLEDGIARDYSDDFGFNKATLLGGVRSFRAQYDALLIFITSLKVEVAPDQQTAQAIFIAKVLAKAHGTIRESEIRADRYRVYFRKTDGGWKITRLESPQLKFE